MYKVQQICHVAKADCKNSVDKQLAKLNHISFHLFFVLPIMAWLDLVQLSAATQLGRDLYFHHRRDINARVFAHKQTFIIFELLPEAYGNHHQINPSIFHCGHELLNQVATATTT